MHPLTRRVLLAEYGVEPIRIGQRDLLFSMLSFVQLRDRVEMQKINEELTATIDLKIHDALALHLQRVWYMVGAHLFRWHKDMMCRYADTSSRLGRPVKTAIEEWLNLFGVEEDDYGMEAAYKCWQRWNEKIKVQSPVFFAHLRGKASAEVGKKTGIKKDLRWTVPDVEVELCASRFSEIAGTCLRRVPKRLHQHVRIYLYMQLQGLSRRKAAKKLNIPDRTAGYAYRSLSDWVSTDPVMAHLMAQAMAYQSKS